MSRSRRYSPQSGFTLIEALIALLVLSIGMLGVAAMQLKALQGAHAAYQRSIASLAAQDAQERLWAVMAKDPNNLICPSWGEAQNIDGASWHAQWVEFLPGLNSSPVSESVGCQFDISVGWSDSRFENEDAPVFEYTIRLPGS
ncbi:type IV pilus modification protein PilV [Franzmannia qiaohouensis]|uniref:Type IV pilus modification protein PilV n=1 Tax=Franzmannia qiaohouensis TaxID=1329370 RepID=A0ABU1HKN1_9GAMM|nr:type IV pilus modification protein PilV [Halomonas qiaohouensis]MDR5907155.1 type IV pilus modification protein PilV [Halomonas qiaohouensis]